MNGTWTVERDETLLAMRAQGKAWPSILVTLNRMEGVRIASAEAVYLRHKRLQDSIARLCAERNSPRNSAGDGEAGPNSAGCDLDVSSLNSPPDGSPPGGAFLGVYQVVSYDDAKRWAVRHGLAQRRMGLDLRTVNAVRKRAGALPFLLEGAG